jgi:hypothetical protein
MVNVLHFRGRGAAGGTPEDLMPRIDGWVTAQYAGVHSVERKFDIIDIAEAGSLNPLGYALPPTTTAGANANAGGNPAEAIVLSLKSVLRSRRANGRMYLGGFPNLWVSQGTVIGPAGINGLTTFIGATMALFGPNGSEPYELGIFSDPGPDKLGQARPPIFTPCAQIRLNLITGSQRRRRIGVGS